MFTDSILLKFLHTDSNKQFYQFSNTDGKTWLMPSRNMRIAMNLYQPSGRNGKLVKNWFPWLHKVPLVRNVIHAEKLCCGMKEELRLLLEQLFQEKELEFSVFCGTPCVHQKITIQLSKEKRILGYCKLSDSEEVARLFQSEAKVLEYLAKQGLTGIPRCLYCGELCKGIHLFVQSTTKSMQSQVPHEWNVLHESFLKELHEKTKQKIKFDETDYYKTLLNLQHHLDWLPSTINRIAVETAIAKIMAAHGKQMVEFSAYHADFTPWNMFVESERLFVFDWEYAQLTYPPRLDRYHFFTQTVHFEKHWTFQQIVEYMQSEQGVWIDKDMYLQYLLDVMSRFTLREKGKVTRDVAGSFNLWINLLEYLNK